jgi:hypothetical protein
MRLDGGRRCPIFVNEDYDASPKDWDGRYHVALCRATVYGNGDVDNKFRLVAQVVS